LLWPTEQRLHVRSKGRERNSWMGTAIGMLGSYVLKGQVTTGNGSGKKGSQWMDRWKVAGKATVVGAPDEDILAAAIEILRKQIVAETATCLANLEAHRGESANEGANMMADRAISDPKVGKKWCQRTNRAVFTWQKIARQGE